MNTQLQVVKWVFLWFRVDQSASTNRRKLQSVLCNPLWDRLGFERIPSPSTNANNSEKACSRLFEQKNNTVFFRIVKRVFRIRNEFVPNSPPKHLTPIDSGRCLPMRLLITTGCSGTVSNHSTSVRRCSKRNPSNSEPFKRLPNFLMPSQPNSSVAQMEQPGCPKSHRCLPRSSFGRETPPHLCETAAVSVDWSRCCSQPNRA